MLVTTTNVLGTIGGGALEHAALIHAHELLVDDEHSACVQMREWTLGKALSQCCGGRVSLMFDRIPACDFFVECPAGSHYLVMTHSHERDLEVVEAVLSRGDAAFCGLIASRSKAQAFRSRLSRKGFSDAEVAQLTAPLGARVRTGNTPMEVAIAAPPPAPPSAHPQISAPSGSHQGACARLRAP